MLKAVLLRSKPLAIAWFTIMNFLFMIPGSSLPSPGWVADLHFDKVVHLVLFAGLVFFWCSAFKIASSRTWLVILISGIYGLLVEMAQDQWVPNRTFDVFDLVADVAGSIAGVMVWSGVYKKNKPL